MYNNPNFEEGAAIDVIFQGQNVHIYYVVVNLIHVNLWRKTIKTCSSL